MLNPRYLSILAIVGLVGCSQPSATGDAPASAGGMVDAQKTLPDTRVDAPSAQYRLDPNHASLRFAVKHLGLADYVGRFTKYSVDLKLDAGNLAQSSLQVEIDPRSVTADYSGDYKATHKKSPYATWAEDMARSPKFFNADAFPKIEYRSTRVVPGKAGQLQVEGELTLLGKTRPVVLDVQVSGVLPKHPFTGAAAVGFSASGKFLRSEFGMTHLIEPGFVADEVTIRFDGELHQVPEEA